MKSIKIMLLGLSFIILGISFKIMQLGYFNEFIPDIIIQLLSVIGIAIVIVGFFYKTDY